MGLTVKLRLNNNTEHTCQPNNPANIAWKGTTHSSPQPASAGEYGVQAGEFHSSGPVSTIKCATMYEAPNPKMAIVLFVIVPLVGDNKVKVACVQQTEEVDDNFLYVMEQSNRNTDTDSFQYWVGGKLKTFKVRGSITQGCSPTATFLFEEEG